MARHYPEARWATPGELHLNLIFRGLLKNEINVSTPFHHDLFRNSLQQHETSGG
jgi:hypothetical protein